MFGGGRQESQSWLGSQAPESQRALPPVPDWAPTPAVAAAALSRFAPAASAARSARPQAQAQPWFSQSQASLVTPARSSLTGGPASQQRAPPPPQHAAAPPAFAHAQPLPWESAAADGRRDGRAAERVRPIAACQPMSPPRASCCPPGTRSRMRLRLTAPCSVSAMCARSSTRLRQHTPPRRVLAAPSQQQRLPTRADMPSAAQPPVLKPPAAPGATPASARPASAPAAAAAAAFAALNATAVEDRLAAIEASCAATQASVTSLAMALEARAWPKQPSEQRARSSSG